MITALKEGVTTPTVQLQFNGDTGNNYDYRYMTGGAAYATATAAGTSSIQLNGTGANETFFFTVFVHNEAAILKPVCGTGYSTGEIVFTCGGAWNNVADQITRVDVIFPGHNVGAGSEVIVFGCDDA